MLPNIPEIKHPDRYGDFDLPREKLEYALAEAVKASPDIQQLYTFTSCSSALEWLENNAVNVAFLDISMRGMGGLALAEKISQLQPSCKIVFSLTASFIGFFTLLHIFLKFLNSG